MSYKLKDIKKGDLIYVENLTGYGDYYYNKHFVAVVVDYYEVESFSNTFHATISFNHPITGDYNHVNDYEDTLDVFYRVTCPALDIMRGEK